MSKVVVIGGGASGLVSAIRASVNNEVIILEKNEKCGKKILLTGNGKCNYWNSDINIKHYNTDYPSNLEEIINENNQNEVLSFFADIGIYPRIKNGYFYPYSNQSSSIRELLMLEIEKRNIKIIYNFNVESIEKQNNQFIIRDNDKEIKADKVILASGSCACPKSGSDGAGYVLAEKLGHTINKVTPSLVQLKGKGNYFKDWDGVRVDCKVELYIDNEKIKEDAGEIQLTDYGVSGICIFNLSGLASKNLYLNKKVTIKINFVPFLTIPFYDFFSKRNDLIKNRTIGELLESILNYKLTNVLLKQVGINKNEYWNNLTEEEKNKLSNIIESFDLEIIDTLSFDRAQVATGGISLKEIDPLTMESKKVKNLYLIGEVLDVDGECGGFNLAFAFITGFIAGGSV